MQIALGGLNDVRNYLDDIANPEWGGDRERILRALRRLRELKLYLKIQKCKLAAEKRRLLGHIVSSKGVMRDEERAFALRSSKRPSNQKELASLVGVLGTFRMYIEGYADKLEPLRTLKKGKEKRTQGIEWKEEQEKAFLQLVDDIEREVMLVYPN
eukprot:GHVN01023171.1.p3 GENE.GHVN01023171.1~~GHVN01023171.1.p3  ORF type:complete len:156 (-),score=13.44 GHVN01023171.1:1046-1513(-)